MNAHLFIPDAVASRVLGQGPDAVDWLNSVPLVADAAARAWGVDIGYPIDQPSDAVVIRGRRGAHPVVLKLWYDKERWRAEHAVLAAAKGMGYAKLLQADAELGALLLESLGSPLDVDALERVGGADPATGIIAGTLRAAWRVTPAAWRAPAAAHPAERLRDAILLHPAPLDVPDCRGAVDRALAYADQRLDADEPARHVLAHGNPHPGNLRAVQRPRPGAESGFVLIDPRPVLAPPEYDLGVTLRDGNRQLLNAEDAVVWARDWCARLAERTATDAEAIWQWGYLHRVALGLRLVNGPAPLAGRLTLQTATALIRRWRA